MAQDWADVVAGYGDQYRRGQEAQTLADLRSAQVEKLRRENDLMGGDPGEKSSQMLFPGAPGTTGTVTENPPTPAPQPGAQPEASQYGATSGTLAPGAADEMGRMITPAQSLAGGAPTVGPATPATAGGEATHEDLDSPEANGATPTNTTFTPGKPGRPAVTAQILTEQDAIRNLGRRPDGSVDLALGRQRLAHRMSTKEGVAGMQALGYVSDEAYRNKVRIAGLREEIADLTERRNQAYDEGKDRTGGLLQAEIDDREREIADDHQVKAHFIDRAQAARDHALAASDRGPEGDLIASMRQAEQAFIKEPSSFVNYTALSDAAYKAAESKSRNTQMLGRALVSKLGAYSKLLRGTDQDVQNFLGTAAALKAKDPTIASTVDSFKAVIDNPETRSLFTPAVQRFMKDYGDKDIRARLIGIGRDQPAELDATARALVIAEEGRLDEGKATVAAQTLYSAGKGNAFQANRVNEARLKLDGWMKDLAVKEAQAPEIGAIDKPGTQLYFSEQARLLRPHLRVLEDRMNDPEVQKALQQQATRPTRPSTADLRTEMVGLQARRDGTGPPLSTVEQQRLTALEGQFPVRGKGAAGGLTPGQQSIVYTNSLTKGQAAMGPKTPLGAAIREEFDGQPTKQKEILDYYAKVEAFNIRQGNPLYRVSEQPPVKPSSVVDYENAKSGGTNWWGGKKPVLSFPTPMTPSAPPPATQPAPRDAAPTSKATPPAGAALPPPPDGAKEGDRFFDGEGGRLIVQGGQLVRGPSPNTGDVFKKDMKIKNSKTGQTGTLHQGTPLPPGVLVLGGL